MQGERSNEEKIQLEAKIKDLTEELDQKNNTHTLLTLQLKRLQVIKLWFNITFDIALCSLNTYICAQLSLKYQICITLLTFSDSVSRF